MITRAGRLALAASGFAGLTLPKIDVYVNDFTPDELSVWTDFAKAAYTGYAQATATIGAVFVDQQHRVSAPVLDAVFLGPTAGAGVDAFGWVLSDGTTHTVWAADRFNSAPASLQALLDRLEVDVILHLDGSDDFEIEN